MIKLVVSVLFGNGIILADHRHATTTPNSGDSCLPQGNAGKHLQGPQGLQMSRMKSHAKHLGKALIHLDSHTWNWQGSSAFPLVATSTSPRPLRSKLRSGPTFLSFLCDCGVRSCMPLAACFYCTVP